MSAEIIADILPNKTRGFELITRRILKELQEKDNQISRNYQRSAGTKI